jgi:hypothetical protein
MLNQISEADGSADRINKNIMNMHIAPVDFDLKAFVSECKEILPQSN